MSIDGELRADDVWIGVRDSGVGMDDTVLAHCRDPSFLPRGSGRRARSCHGHELRHASRWTASRLLGPGVGTEVVLVLAHDAQSLEKRVEDASKVEAGSRRQEIRTGEVILPPVLSAAKDWVAFVCCSWMTMRSGSRRCCAPVASWASAQAAATGDEALTHFVDPRSMWSSRTWTCRVCAATI